MNRPRGLGECNITNHDQTGPCYYKYDANLFPLFTISFISAPCKGEMSRGVCVTIIALKACSTIIMVLHPIGKQFVSVIDALSGLEKKGRHAYAMRSPSLKSVTPAPMAATYYITHSIKTQTASQ
jgi:hypothetical protein